MSTETNPGNEMDCATTKLPAVKGSPDSAREQRGKLCDQEPMSVRDLCTVVYCTVLYCTVLYSTAHSKRRGASRGERVGMIGNDTVLYCTCTKTKTQMPVL
jgi:hypothetical protein